MAHFTHRTTPSFRRPSLHDRRDHEAVGEGDDGPEAELQGDEAEGLSEDVEGGEELPE